MPSPLERTGCWFLHSGIQEPGGGVARYYLADGGRNLDISTEITGYTVSALLYLYRATGNAECLDAARLSGTFLAETAWDDARRSMPFEYGSDKAFTYFFDCGIIARALLRLYEATGEPSWLDSARRCADSMRSDFASEGVEFHPILSLPDKQPTPYGTSWSTRPGCFQLKAALAWQELYEITGEAAYQRDYAALVSHSLPDHAEFPLGEQPRRRIMDRLHAYCYFLEGLLPLAGEAECKRVLRDGIALTARLVREVAPEFARSDVYGQLLRVRLYLDALGVEPLDVAAAAEEADCAAGFQADSNDPRLRGGYFFGRRGGEMIPHVNPVSTAFCLQALEMWRRWHQGERPTDTRILI